MHKQAEILIVEDELVLLDLLRTGLEDEGFVVHQAANALGAFEMLHRHPAISMVVTDIGLPGSGDGQDLASYLRASHADMPVLFVSGAKPADSGDIDLLLKPFSIDTFVSAVKSRLPG